VSSSETASSSGASRIESQISPTSWSRSGTLSLRISAMSRTRKLYSGVALRPAVAPSQPNLGIPTSARYRRGTIFGDGASVLSICWTTATRGAIATPVLLRVTNETVSLEKQKTEAPTPSRTEQRAEAPSPSTRSKDPETAVRDQRRPFPQVVESSNESREQKLRPQRPRAPGDDPVAAGRISSVLRQLAVLPCRNLEL
jgi:hypothetical protein